jgi:hypothetical protein
VTLLESCNSLWEFDEDRMQFRRAPKPSGPADPLPVAQWDPYVALEVDADTGNFAVVLTDDRTRVLRSHVHGRECPWCASLTASVQSGS